MNPNLFVAGVPKAGTTSLFHYLALHPDIFPSNRKEPGFFHPFKIKDMAANLEAYKKFFIGYSGQKYAIEATPGYFYGGKETATAINKYSPESKIIIVLRNPVERLFSFYKYKKSLGHIDGNLNFDTYIVECKKQNDPIKRETYDFWAMIGGKYSKLLSEWYGVFEERIMFCFFDDMIKDEPKFIEKICKWLDLDKKHIDDGKAKVQNKSMIYRSKRLQRVATSFDSMFSGVWYYLPWIKLPFSGLYNLFNAKPHNETISDSLRAELIQYYQDDIKQTSDFLKEKQIENLPGWLIN